MTVAVVRAPVPQPQLRVLGKTAGDSVGLGAGGAQSNSKVSDFGDTVEHVTQ